MWYKITYRLFYVIEIVDYIQILDNLKPLIRMRNKPLLLLRHIYVWQTPFRFFGTIPPFPPFGTLSSLF